MESNATISAFRRSATSRASSVLPEAVGPVRIRALRNGSGVMPPFMKTDCRVPAKGAEPTEQRIMPKVEATHVIPRPVAEVFEFFRRTANLPRVAPPELQLRLEAGPERLELGSRV